MPARILIGISTYNEIENLPRLVQEIDQHLPEADLLIVDDKSPDGTGDWGQALSAERGDVDCIQRSGKLGLGSATVTTFRYAIEHGYEYLVNMDADLSHRPEFLPSLLAVGQKPDVDVAVGSRYIRGGNVVGWPVHRVWMSRAINTFARMVLRLPTRDCSGSFRCYRVGTLKKMDLERIQSQGYSFFEEVLYHLNRQGARFEEVPITFYDRTRGHSKINLREAWNALRTLVYLALFQPR